MQLINCVNCGLELGHIDFRTGGFHYSSPGDKSPAILVDEDFKVIKRQKGQPAFMLGEGKTITCPNCGAENGIY